MHGYKILLIEDCRINVLLAQKLLTQLGHTVLAVTDTGEDALIQAELLKPDLVLMDVNLAGSLNGMEATRILVERFDIPVVLVTGESSDEVLDRIPQSLAGGFISKPINREELKAGLAIAIHKHDIEQRLRASEKKYRTIFNNSAAGIYISDATGHYIDCNDTFAKMLGYDNSRDLLDSVTNIAEQVYVEPGRYKKLLLLLRDHNIVKDFESEVYGRDGDAFWISEHCQAEVDSFGQLYRFETVVLDITGRVEMEAAYRATLDLLQRTIDTVPEIVFLLDMDRNIILCNKAFGSKLGKCNEELIGHSNRKFICGNCPAGEDCFHEMAHLGKFTSIMYHNIELSGTLYSMAVAPFFDLKGKVVGAVHTLAESSHLVSLRAESADAWHIP